MLYFVPNSISGAYFTQITVIKRFFKQKNQIKKHKRKAIFRKINHLDFGKTRPSMIGSPEGVKIQRSSVQNLSKIQQRLKIIGCFLTFWGLKYPQGVTTNFGGQKNIKNEFRPIKLLRVQIFSKIRQLLKITILGGFLTFRG